MTRGVMKDSVSFRTFASLFLSNVAGIGKVQYAPIPKDGRRIRESPSRY